MKFNLKVKDSVAVGKRSEERYLYEDESGQVTVQFHAGTKAWTFAIDDATNEKGRALASALINKWVEQAAAAVRDGNFGDEFIQTLEV